MKTLNKVDGASHKCLIICLGTRTVSQDVEDLPKPKLWRKQLLLNLRYLWERDIYQSHISLRATSASLPSLTQVHGQEHGLHPAIAQKAALEPHEGQGPELSQPPTRAPLTSLAHAPPETLGMLQRAAKMNRNQHLSSL